MNPCGRSNCAFILSILTAFGVTNVRYRIRNFRIIFKNICIPFDLTDARYSSCSTHSPSFLNTVIFLVKCKIILTKI